MVPWIPCTVIDLDLGTPIEERYGSVPEDVFIKGRRLLQAVMQEIPPATRLLADAVRLRTRNRFHKEVCSFAKHVGGDWRAVMIANVAYDLALSTYGCSTVALPTSAGPVLARNLDWWPQDVLAQTSLLIRYFTEGRMVYANAGWPGTIGVVSGASGRGFAVALNAVMGPEGTDKAGYPVLLHIRRVLEDAEDFDSAVEMLSTTRLAAPCLLTVVGTQNDQRVVIERSPRKHARRWGEPGRPLAATNDYRLLFTSAADSGEKLYQTSSSRYEALCGLFADHTADQEVDDTVLLRALTDPAVMQDITAQHVIMRPYSHEIRMFVPRRLVEGQNVERRTSNVGPLTFDF